MLHATVLNRDDVTLRPLCPDDAPMLRSIVDTDSWAGMSVALPTTDAAMSQNLQLMLGTPGTIAFAVEQGGRFVGRTTLYDLVPGLRVEIGNTIYARDVWGTSVNPAAKLLLFTHAFEDLGLVRVALRCDHRNTRSHRAIARLGATFEGTLRQFRPAADGTIVDIDYFSVVRHDWPRVRVGLEARLPS